MFHQDIKFIHVLLIYKPPHPQFTQKYNGSHSFSTRANFQPTMVGAIGVLWSKLVAQRSVNQLMCN